MVPGLIALGVAAAMHSWALGALGGLLLGLRFGGSLAISRLGEFERRERMARIRNWRHR